jgi:hypothetical protein
MYLKPYRAPVKIKKSKIAREEELGTKKTYHERYVILFAGY